MVGVDVNARDAERSATVNEMDAVDGAKLTVPAYEPVKLNVPALGSVMVHVPVPCTSVTVQLRLPSETSTVPVDDDGFIVAVMVVGFG